MSNFIKLPDGHVINADHVVDCTISANTRARVNKAGGGYYDINCDSDGEAEDCKRQVDELLMRSNGIEEVKVVGGEMLPLWLKFPDNGFDGWCMGEAGDYKVAWRDYWNSLSFVAQAAYIDKYPEPKGWEGFYE